MPRDLARYERFGWDFELHNPLSDEEVAWYLRWAEATGGPVLGLACGTGRLLCRVAVAGFEVVGLDLSAAMLALARRNATRLEDAAGLRVRLVQDDMASFELGQRFGLITIADNSFRELQTREQLRACLDGIRRHLEPRGRLLVTERRFDPAQYAKGPRLLPWSEPCRNPETGEVVARQVELALSTDGRRLRGTMHYRVLEPPPERIIDLPIDVPVLQLEEYLSLFEEAGFSAEAFGGYDGRGSEEAGTHWCFVCRSTAGP